MIQILDANQDGKLLTQQDAGAQSLDGREQAGWSGSLELHKQHDQLAQEVDLAGDIIPGEVPEGLFFFRGEITGIERGDGMRRHIFKHKGHEGLNGERRKKK
jgi:hypothetical protein